MKSGPDLPIKTQVAYALMCLCLFITVLPAINSWIKTHIPRYVHARAQAPRDAELARHYAAVLAACFNGEAITDGALIVECRRK